MPNLPPRLKLKSQKLKSQKRPSEPKGSKGEQNFIGRGGAGGPPGPDLVCDPGGCPLLSLAAQKCGCSTNSKQKSRMGKQKAE
jgi:hypothetical protein